MWPHSPKLLMAVSLRQVRLSMGKAGGDLSAPAPAPRLLVPPLVHPAQEPVHARAFAPHQPEETASIVRGFRAPAKESFHPPADVGTLPRTQTVAL